MRGAHVGHLWGIVRGLFWLRSGVEWLRGLRECLPGLIRKGVCAILNTVQ